MKSKDVLSKRKGKESKNEKKKCPTCGTPNDIDSKFCDKCDTLFETSAQNSTAEKTTNDSPEKNPADTNTNQSEPKPVRTAEQQDTNIELEKILGAPWGKVSAKKIESLTLEEIGAVRKLILDRLDELKSEENTGKPELVTAVRANCERILEYTNRAIEKNSPEVIEIAPQQSPETWTDEEEKLLATLASTIESHKKTLEIIRAERNRLELEEKYAAKDKLNEIKQSPEKGPEVKTFSEEEIKKEISDLLLSKSFIKKILSPGIKLEEIKGKLVVTAEVETEGDIKGTKLNNNVRVGLTLKNEKGRIVVDDWSAKIIDEDISYLARKTLDVALWAFIKAKASFDSIPDEIRLFIQQKEKKEVSKVEIESGKKLKVTFA